jgi:cell division transport system permease protein
LDHGQPVRSARDPMPSFEAPIVPSGTISGRALVAVVAIMTFLASLTTGAVMLVRTAADDWQAEVSREVTIQVRPITGRDIEADVARAAEITRGTAGVADVRPFTKEESMQLLEPWLGTGVTLGDLPVPRIIVVRRASGVSLDLPQLRTTLTDQVPSAMLDDHRGFVDRMRAMARAVFVGGLAILALVFAATILSVTFATRGAMAANRTVVEVLHLIGAKTAFIATHFQRHFLVLGLKGGLIGGGSAIALFALAELASRHFLGTAAADQFAALFGTFSIGPFGYTMVFLQIGLIALVTAATSRFVVSRTLDTFQ